MSRLKNDRQRQERLAERRLDLLHNNATKKKEKDKDVISNVSRLKLQVGDTQCHVVLLENLVQGPISLVHKR